MHTLQTQCGQNYAVAMLERVGKLTRTSTISIDWPIKARVIACSFACVGRQNTVALLCLVVLAHWLAVNIHICHIHTQPSCSSTERCPRVTDCFIETINISNSTLTPDRDRGEWKSYVVIALSFLPSKLYICCDHKSTQQRPATSSSKLYIV